MENTLILPYIDTVACASQKAKKENIHEALKYLPYIYNIHNQ